MEFVVDDAERYKRTHVEKIFHGKSESISFTSLWVKTGASGPKVRAGNPASSKIVWTTASSAKSSRAKFLRLRVYEDDKVFVFEDINPKAPTHVLIVPKRHIVGLKEATPEDAEIIGYCQLIAAKLGRERGIEDGYRTVYNVGPKSGQSVFHLHLHLLGGRDLKWPPG